MEVTELAVSAFAALLAWLWLALLRGGFWRCDRHLPFGTSEPDIWPTVAAVIPARNEAETIARSVRSLLVQDYPGGLVVVVVDDQSTDRTTDEVRRAATAAKVEIVSGAPLPAGWTGKVWAMHQGLRRVDAVSPMARYVLLTDADIGHGADSLRLLVARAEAEGLDLVSLMVRLRCEAFWERWLIPAFVFFFQKLYPFAWVNDPDRLTAAAAGGCMLVRRAALDRIGGIAAIRGRVIDDCALAAEIAREGRIWIGLARKSHSIRGYDGLSGIWNMVARSAYVQVGNSPLLLAGTVAGMAFLYVLPPAALIAGFIVGDAAALAFGAAGWALMSALYVPMLLEYGLGAWRAPLLPLVAALYTAMTLSSAWRHYRGRGAAWKGRAYGAPPGGDGNGA